MLSVHTRAHAAVAEVSENGFHNMNLFIACKKDHTRSDYRKAEKNRPGVWYLICASIMILLQFLIMFELGNVFFFARDSLCKEAQLIDIINIGRPLDEEDRKWTGVQRLPAQVQIFTDESAIAKEKYEDSFEPASKFDWMSTQLSSFEILLADLQTFESKTVPNFEKEDSDYPQFSTLTDFENGYWGPATE